jgi:hypothetical protein
MNGTESLNNRGLMVGPKLSEAQIMQIRHRLEDVFKRQFEYREKLRKERSNLDDALLGPLRKLVSEDPMIESSVKKAREIYKDRAKLTLDQPVRANVKPSSRFEPYIDITHNIPPPYLIVIKSCNHSGSATGTCNADSSGTMGFNLTSTGNGHSSARVGLSLPNFYYIKPGETQVIFSITPSFTFSQDAYATGLLPVSACSSAKICLLVNQWTKQEQPEGDLICYPKTIWYQPESGPVGLGVPQSGTNPGYPLSVTITSVDDKHYYTFLVIAEGSVSSSESLGTVSNAESVMNLTLPIITLECKS